MKKLTVLFAGIALTTSISAQTLSSKNDSVSYAMGVTLANQIENIKEEYNFNLKKLAQGFYDYFNSEQLKISFDSSKSIITKTFAEIEEEKKKSIQELCIKNSDYLQENAKKDGVITLENGLQYKVITKTKNDTIPVAGDEVLVHYSGSLIDGTIFDSSIKRGEPAKFPVDAVIPGFAQVIKLMPVGSTYIAYIPSDLGYGMRQAGSIPECSTLIFEIQLLKVFKGNNVTEQQPAETIDSKSQKKLSKKEKRAKQK